jgi:hypothetical protein
VFIRWIHWTLTYWFIGLCLNSLLFCFLFCSTIKMLTSFPFVFTLLHLRQLAPMPQLYYDVRESSISSTVSAASDALWRQRAAALWRRLLLQYLRC